ncbi:hypothetical protein EQK42_00725 [Streptomyces albidoflavus]|uniref:hypothetical protein n=1 Tax=Streptomyces albidoflavus TaxID=1886 RepID=UPI000FF078DC|nr:hypothetical protein [Streptomyces albidoflavus]RWZ77882.1 hypothetical protein EQK42_00725 [Streptomyces albidoflavus]
MTGVTARTETVRRWVAAAVAAGTARRPGFAAFGLPEDIVHAAVGTTDPDAVACLLGASLDGPIYQYAGQYFAIVPPGAPPLPLDDVGLYRGDELDLPGAHQQAPADGAYWVTTPSSAESRCRVPDVARLAVRGRVRAREEAARAVRPMR